ncbi:UNVERIFIED_ORG: hypothetical protein QIH99_gp27 [Proteus phage VB_PmiS-Isfahan]|uniref:Uncharacterized protein n=1 Tax=Proteus phage VB_PmiS-Isfahan TaxID=1969841 RepID=A0A1U9ZA81_9CAUD
MGNINTIIAIIGGLISLFNGIFQISFGIANKDVKSMLTGSFFTTCGIGFSCYGIYLLMS